MVAACGLLLACNRATAESIALEAEEFWSDGAAAVDSFEAEALEADPAQFSQPLTPRIEAGGPAPQPSITARNADLFAPGAARRSLAQSTSLSAGMSYDTVLGRDATVRATTDAGDLLGSSPQVLNLGVQRRNPIVTDPRVRGSRVGSLAASGSYWVPARIDLDTMVSKLDSHIIERTTVVPGPYSALHGPGLQFIDVDLLRAPQFEGGFEAHGRSMVDFKSNGEQWHGRQSFWGGDDVWGFRGGYGHRTGNDYTTGAGTLVPSSYKSRDVDLAFVGALTESSLLDVQYLRLDQTDVELPGQAFDIDVLVTDGFEATLVEADSSLWDELLVTTWYNRTTLNGSAQRSGKRRTFPYYDQIGFVGFTDVDSQSTGASGAATWTTAGDSQLTAGADLRYVRQELNEISSAPMALDPFTSASAPIPESHQANPGVFVELGNSPLSVVRLRAGARVDFVATDVDEDPANLQDLGVFDQSAADILGSGDFEQDELLGLAYLTAAHDLTDRLELGAKVGYAERAPNLTEYYAVQPFMFLLQNGLNTVTGDPTLDKERLIQADVSAALTGEYGRTRLNLFHAWARDYITFENIGVVDSLPTPMQPATPVQVNLKYVNTDMATLMGAESESEVNLTSLTTAFLNLKYVEGEDRTRNGNFATAAADGFGPSTRDPTRPRGFFADPTLATADQEPLPSILPLDVRVGLRIGSPEVDAPWGVEISSRIVDNQDRVAASLLEMPTPGFTIYDLRGFYRPQGSLLLVAGVENFTDKAFREHLDFRSFDGSIVVLQPGANFYCGGELTY